jgi:hypothetical protein
LAALTVIGAVLEDGGDRTDFGREAIGRAIKRRERSARSKATKSKI